MLCICQSNALLISAEEFYLRFVMSAPLCQDLWKRELDHCWNAANVEEKDMTFSIFSLRFLHLFMWWGHFIFWLIVGDVVGEILFIHVSVCDSVCLF